MPGLTGIISPGSRMDCTETVRAMLDCMTRTSDSVSGSFNHPALGVWSGWVCANGTFADCLPVWNETRDVCLLFSGECFGLKQEIKRLGQNQPSSHPNDAGYLVHLYEEEGEAFICKLNGFFAGLLIDLRNQRILLFNDRYGLGRLYLHETGGCVFFASEAKSLLAVLPGLRRVDPRALGEWFSCGCVLQDRTLFQGVSLLPAGSCWVFTADGKVSKRKYFDPAAWESQPRLTEADYYDRLKELFPQILNRYFQGRSRIGMSLTGGLDGRRTRSSPRLVGSWRGDPPRRDPTGVRTVFPLGNAQKSGVLVPASRAELRSIDRAQAIQILESIDYYLTTGAGDVIQLQPPRTEFRLRVGDYRVLFVPRAEATIEVMRVRHRSEAYR